MATLVERLRERLTYSGYMPGYDAALMAEAATEIEFLRNQNAALTRDAVMNDVAARPGPRSHAWQAMSPGESRFVHDKTEDQ